MFDRHVAVLSLALWFSCPLGDASHGVQMRAVGLLEMQPFTEAKVTTFDVDVPKPGDSEILVSVEGSSVNHFDLLWSLLGSPVAWSVAEAHWQLWHSFPKVLGMDIAGTVVGLGSGPTRFNLGDKVWAMNAGAALWDGRTVAGLAGHAWAPYVAVDDKYVGLKPLTMNFTEAGVLPLVGQTSLAALKELGAPWDRRVTVLILGSTGGVGHVAVQLAKAMGATTVIGTGAAANADFVRSLGADHFIDYHTEDWWTSDVVGDFSVDAVFDTVLEKGTGDRAFQKLRDGGRYVSLCNGIPQCGAELPSRTTQASRPTVSATALRCGVEDCASSLALDELRSYVDSGLLRVHVDAIVSLEDINHGIDLLQSHHAGKIAVSSHPADDLSVFV
jgi:NADPH:quinone reductase-like Zn-dependent oxidoreductase